MKNTSTVCACILNYFHLCLLFIFVLKMMESMSHFWEETILWLGENSCGLQNLGKLILRQLRVEMTGSEKHTLQLDKWWPRLGWIKTEKNAGSESRVYSMWLTNAQTRSTGAWLRGDGYWWCFIYFKVLAKKIWMLSPWRNQKYLSRELCLT